MTFGSAVNHAGRQINILNNEDNSKNAAGPTTTTVKEEPSSTSAPACTPSPKSPMDNTENVEPATKPVHHQHPHSPQYQAQHHQPPPQHHAPQHPYGYYYGSYYMAPHPHTAAAPPPPPPPPPPGYYQHPPPPPQMMGYYHHPQACVQAPPPPPPPHQQALPPIYPGHHALPPASHLPHAAPPAGGSPPSHTQVSSPDNRSPAPTASSRPQRKYACHCGRSFTTSGHLARHTRIHTGEKNYVCPYEGCGSRFSRQDNCMQHYRTHLGGRGRANRSRRKVVSKSPERSMSSDRHEAGTSPTTQAPQSSSHQSSPDTNPLNAFAGVAILQTVR